MPTFADSLLKPQNDQLSFAQATLRQDGPYWEAAIKDACQQNRTARHISGFIVQPIPAEGAAIYELDRLTTVSPEEWEKSLRKSLEKSPGEHKHTVYQNSAGQYIRSGLVTGMAEHVNYYVPALQEMIRKMGFVRYTVTAVPLKDIERTAKRGSGLFATTKVIDQVRGTRYALYIDIYW